MWNKKLTHNMSSFKRICLWSGPRNISTTLMYSFAQRPDTNVYDEPLYAHYLSNSDASEYHPGAEAILASQKTNGEEVIQDMLKNESSPVATCIAKSRRKLDLPVSECPPNAARPTFGSNPSTSIGYSVIFFSNNASAEIMLLSF